ncbi:MAG TPA: histidine kinase, partial [Solirubrobacteraceae bacterium]|nr:histidine kinase [Solirubrobacteraceae bacterium]
GDIERAGREALVELRRLLGVLRAGAPQPLSPTPTTREVHDLAAAARAKGVPVGLTVEGTPDAVPAGIAVSVYRIVEAAMDEGLEQRAARVRVALRYTGEATEIDVSADSSSPHDDAEPRAPMAAAIRERVAVCGGQARVERRPNGAVRVWARLPHHGFGPRAPAETGPVDRDQSVAARAVEPAWRRAAEASVAPILFAALVVDAHSGGTLDGGELLNVAAFALLAGTFAWRRRAPVVAAAALAAVSVALTAFLTPVPDLQTAKVAFLAMVYLTAAGTEGRAAALGASVLAAGALGTMVAHGVSELTSRQVYALVTFAALAWFAGRLVRSHSELNRALAERAAAAEREQEEREWRAVADLRRQIARELHDVVAHGLTVMVVQAGSARRIAEADPQEAVLAVELIEATGREALAEMRRLLFVIADGDEAAPRMASPGMASLETLLERSRAAGVDVELRRDGPPRPLPAGVELAAYRVVQEALTNTIKHAHAARAQLVVRYRDDALELLIADDGDGRAMPLAGGGHGLAGMRERVSVFGGELEAHAEDGRGFVVRARFPLENAA